MPALVRILPAAPPTTVIQDFLVSPEGSQTVSGKYGLGGRRQEGGVQGKET